MDLEPKDYNLQHIAFIPDGNRRWAKAQGKKPWQGHIEGVKRFWELAEASTKLGIHYLTFWAGSFSNLANRSKEEVDVLFQLLGQELTDPKLIAKLKENQTSFKLVGEWEQFSSNPKLKQILDDVELETKEFSKHHLTILFGYDGQREMLSAIENLKNSGEEVTEESLEKNLLTGFLPDVDFLIRTGGEPHWSAGFLMWQTANSQLFFTDELWPDFKVPQLKTALEDFERRERRLGK